MNTKKNLEHAHSGNSSHFSAEKRPHWIFRIPPVLFWTVLAVLIFGIVYSYDRQGRNTIRVLQTNGVTAEVAGKYQHAISSYVQAFENSRASNRTKGELAVRIADLYFDKLNDATQASYWYVVAKRHYPKVLSSPEKAALLRERIVVDSADATPHKSMLFVPSPDGDNDGPLIAVFDGGEVYEGGVLRAAKADGLTTEIAHNYVADELLFRASIEAGVLDRPEVMTQLFDAQRTIAIEAYLHSMRHDQLSTATGQAKDTVADQLKRKYHLKYQ